MLDVDKDSFNDFMKHVNEQRLNEMNEALKHVQESSKAGHKAILRLEKKSDWKTVEQVTYRAFRDAPPMGDDYGNEALLARKLRSRTAFVPQLNYVAELNGAVIGNIMYTRSKVVNSDNEWETLNFGPVSVLPKYQRDGVGSALIRKTLAVARELEMLIIKAACEDYDDTTAYKAIDRLKEARWSGQTTKLIDEIFNTLMLRSDFEKAAELANQRAEQYHCSPGPRSWGVNCNTKTLP